MVFAFGFLAYEFCDARVMGDWQLDPHQFHPCRANVSVVCLFVCVWVCVYDYVYMYLFILKFIFYFYLVL